jgi:CBS domain-containing protein
LDGGRVFRGSVWKRSRNFIGATKTATRVSEAISLLMMVGGFVSIIFGNFVDGIWIIFLGWFIRSGAETSLRQTLIGEALAGVTVGDIMTRDVMTAPGNITIHQLVTNFFLVHPHGGYPVVEDSQILGIVTMDCVRSVPQERRDTVTVKEAMIPREQAVTVGASVSAVDAMNCMARQNVGRLLVLDGPRLLGIVTRGDLMRTIRTRQELAT